MSEDILDVYGSLFRQGDEPFRFMDFPIEPVFLTSQAGIRHYQDDVLDKNGNLVGASSGRTYSLYSRDMFSIGTINAELAEIGTEVFVLWGEPGTRQKKVRAVVSKFPHIDIALNSAFDVESIPHPQKKS